MTFSEQVYALVKTIPKGKVTTYGDIACALGTRAYQAVGNILANNPDGFHKSGDVPCHRVVPKNGTLGGYCGKKCGEAICMKKQFLESEGIMFDENNKILNLSFVLHKF